MAKIFDFFKKAGNSFFEYYKNHYLLLEVLIIVIIGLTPLLWFKSSNEILIGHDSGFPLAPIEWFSGRFESWTEKYNLGSDQSLAFGSLPIHGIEAGLSKLGFSIFTVQKLVFIFWFTLPGLSMYALSRYLIGKDRKYAAFRIFASTFYMLNHFLLQGWFIAERTKFSIIAATPLTVLFLLKGLDRKITKLESIFAINLILFFLNGGGSGFTLYGGLILVISAVLLGYLIIKRISFGKLLMYIFAFGSVFFLMQSYWIIPQIYYAVNNFSNVIATFGGDNNLITWANEISKHTSLWNLARLQGVPDWYDNPSHPYSNIFLTSIFFKIIGILTPVFAGAGFIIYSRKKEFNRHLVWLFILTLFALIFTAGTHPPFGFIYEFMLKNVPFFSVFRTPFYKFGYALWFAYSILVPLTISYLFRAKFVDLNFTISSSKDPKKVSIPWEIGGAIILTAIIIIYNYPFFAGNFFKWRDPLTTKVDLPGYVMEYGEWAKNEPAETRILLLPKLNEAEPADIYNWGYYSLEPLPSLLSNTSIVSNNFNLTINQEEKETVSLLYDSLKSSPQTFDNLAIRLGINKILLREDFFYNYGGKDNNSPEDMENLLEQTSFKQVEKFGEWIIYENPAETEQVKTIDSPIEIQYEQTTNLEIIKAILQEVRNKPFIRTDIISNPTETETEEPDKLIFLDTANLASIDPKDGSFTYEIFNRMNSPELVINPVSISSASYNVSVEKNAGKLIIHFSTPEIIIEYANGRKIVPSNLFSKELYVNTSGQNIGIVINGQIFKTENINNGQIVKLGSIQFLPGEEILDIGIFEESEGQVLLGLDFEDDNIRDKTGNCGGESQNVSSKVTQSEGSQGKYLELSAKNAVSCLRLPLDLAKEKTVYKLSFDYFMLSGSSPSLCVLQQSDTASNCIPDITVNEAQKGKWESYQTVFETEEDIKKLILHFYAKSDQEETIIAYDNIKLSKITDLGSGSVTAGDLANLFKEKTIVKLNDFGGNRLKLRTDIFSSNETIQDGSFENGLWGGASVCGTDSNKEPDVFASFSQDRTEGERSLKLESNSGTACVRNKIENFSKNAVYKVSFDYKNLEGEAPRFCLLQLGSSRECLPYVELNKAQKWQNYSVHVIPENDASGLVIHFYSDKGSKNLFDNVIVEKVERPFGLGYLKEFAVEQSPKGLVQTSFTKISATKYKVRVNSLNDSFILELNQAFNPGWKAYVASEKNSKIPEFFKFLFDKPVPENNHYAIDEIKNGWLIENAGTGVEITLEYFPQKIFVVSVVISIVVFVTVFITTLSIFLKNNYQALKKTLWKEDRLKALGKKLDKIIVEP
ncbi:hypothetical protein JW796_04745 [Candidatus Dojkabacteria bacterium]|nr:hypothetical protein [Candidatus Dojkabacteria bacterium]